MIKKLLIANRGEIACRVIRTAKALNIQTIAVYSDADRFSPHRYLADQAVYIGLSPAQESYLDATKILAVAKSHQANAIHPGYGFLSENADFAAACEEAGVIFVGPKAKSIQAMAYKDKAKDIMSAAGIPVIPGFHKADANLSELSNAAKKIGYPVLIKASAGGGGKGMRVVDSAEALEDSLKRARSEALKFFGTDDIILEKYLPTPRHIEVQIFADTAGNVLHLYDRDCSIQRRYQKVIEEAPASGLSQDLKARLYQAAIDAAKAVDYVGAGTLEFLVDGDNFYFMEMNTRLQVEHPVTEAITGIDLVEWQLLVANGDKLPVSQDEITQNGYAVEARLYAENPSNDFLPSTGLIENLCFPESKNTRVDSGVQQGNRVSLFYDPMLAKVICHAGTREDALAKLKTDLANTFISGVDTNTAYLVGLVSELLRSKKLPDTHWLGDKAAEIQNDLEANTATAEIIGIAALIQTHLSTSSNPWNQLQDWRQSKKQVNTYSCWIDEIECRYSFDRTEHGFQILYNGHSYQVCEPELTSTPHRLQVFNATIDNKFYSALIQQRGNQLHVQYLGRKICLDSGSVQALDENKENNNGLTAPMTAQVIQIHCKTGDKVKRGETLMVLEAMKMEHSIKAPGEGVVEAILYQAQDLVEEGQPLVNLKRL